MAVVARLIAGQARAVGKELIRSRCSTDRVLLLEGADAGQAVAKNCDS
jgi:hypothetical protein